MPATLVRTGTAPRPALTARPPSRRERVKRIAEAEAKRNITLASLRNYSDTYLECRDLRHVWNLVGYYRQGGEVRRMLRCERCPMERTDRWSSRGERIATAYHGADDYRISGGVSAMDVRQEALRRAKVFSTFDDLVATLVDQNGQRSIGGVA